MFSALFGRRWSCQSFQNKILDLGPSRAIRFLAKIKNFLSPTPPAMSMWYFCVNHPINARLVRHIIQVGGKDISRGNDSLLGPCAYQSGEWALVLDHAPTRCGEPMHPAVFGTAGKWGKDSLDGHYRKIEGKRYKELYECDTSCPKYAMEGFQLRALLPA